MLNLKLTLSERFPTTKLRHGLAALSAVFVVLIASLGLAATAQAASTKSATLGKDNMSLDPNCGKNFDRECVAEGKVTAYQALSAKSPGRSFVVPWKGKVISWSIKLANPTNKLITKGGAEFPSQVGGFNDVFGSPSQARISILKQVEKKKKGPPRYKLLRQSPVQVLNPYFGTTVQFALSEPLTVNKSNIVALTIPTWAPALWKSFACQPISNTEVVNDAGCDRAESRYTWRGSRAPDKCTLGRDENFEPNEALRKTRPQQKVDSVKRYGCYYGGNVLTYSATIVGP